MKTLKRISTILLAVLLMASLSINAFATIEYVSDIPGEGEGSGTTQLGVLEGTGTVIYQDGSGTNHSLDVSGGTAVTPETGPILPSLNDPDEINDLVQNAISDDLLKPNGQGGVSDPLNGNGQETPPRTTQVYNEDYTGDVSVNGSGEAGIAVLAEAEHDSTASATVTGNVTANGSSTAGAAADAIDSGTASVTVNGNVTASGFNSWGVYADAIDSGSASVTVNGNVAAEGSKSKGIYINTSDNSTASVTVTGDVSGERGINVRDPSSEKLCQTVTVGTEESGGTVTGAIMFESGVTGQNTQITLWKLDGDFTGLNISDDAAAEAAKDVMNYYIRTGDVETDKGSLELTNKDLKTVKEGTNVSFTVSAKENYQIDKVYYTESDDSSLEAVDGVYTFVAPSKGGILLRANFSSKEQPTPEPEPEPEPDPDPKPEPDPKPDPDPKPRPKPEPTPVPDYEKLVKCTVTIHLDGGKMNSGGYSDGSRLTRAIGEKFAFIPEEPVRDGYRFIGWQVIMGDEVLTFYFDGVFDLTGDAIITALWEPIE